MQTMLKRGFTLIELLVVIAIIGILAAVVLGSLNDARDNANDASAQTSINNARNVAEVFYSEQGFTYGTGSETIDAYDSSYGAPTTGTDHICQDADIISLMEAASIQTRSDARCFSDDTQYGVEVGLRNGNSYCIDSTGFAGTQNASTTLGASDFTCG